MNKRNICSHTDIKTENKVNELLIFKIHWSSKGKITKAFYSRFDIHNAISHGHGLKIQSYCSFENL